MMFFYHYAYLFLRLLLAPLSSQGFSNPNLNSIHLIPSIVKRSNSNNNEQLPYYQPFNPKVTTYQLKSISSSTKIVLSASASSPSSEERTSDRHNPNLSSIVNAALLISGTTIGGGFLALPTVTSAVGFVPSSITLFGVWMYFLSLSFVLVECLEYTRNDARVCFKVDANVNSMEESSLSNPGVSTIARNMYGRKGEIIVSILLIILMEATLVSQISKAGSLLFNGQNYVLGCVLSSISIAILVFGPKRRGIEFASKMNSLLTFGFLMSVFGVFVFGVPNANWDQLGIFKNAFGGSQILFSVMNTKGVMNIIPTFLQLLVYGEIIPCVCQLLNYNITAIRIAIAMGSFLTLCLQIGWSGLGIALMTPSQLSVSTGGFSSNDIVNILLQSGGSVQLPLLCLSITAILTTILGSYLALLTMCNNIYNNIYRRKGKDVLFSKSGTRHIVEDVGNIIQSKSSNNTIQQRFVVGSMITFPALIIASTSPSVFLGAIDFAGSYPVLLLWGLLPTSTALLQRRRWLKMTKGAKSKPIGRGLAIQTKDSSMAKSAGSISWIVFLAAISCGMIGLSAKDDFTSLIMKLRNL